MTDEELSGRYAISGTEKNTESVRKPDGRDLRPYMGRKGIGKFSAFSLGDSYAYFFISVIRRSSIIVHLGFLSKYEGLLSYFLVLVQ